MAAFSAGTVGKTSVLRRAPRNRAERRKRSGRTDKPGPRTAPEFRELEFSGIREFRRIAASGPGSGTPAQKFEGRNPQGTKARGNDPRRPRGRTACCPAGIRSVGVSGSRIVLEKDGSVLEFPKQPTHASGSSPRKRPLLRKPENGKLPDRTRLRTGTNRDSQPTGKKTEPSDNRRIATNKNGRTKIGLGGRPFRRGERIPRSAKKPGGRYGTKLGSFTSRRPDEGKIAIILSWYVSCI